MNTFGDAQTRARQLCDMNAIPMAIYCQHSSRGGLAFDVRSLASGNPSRGADYWHRVCVELPKQEPS